MNVVGVIDLLDGRAVHARGGDRARYETVTAAGGASIPNGDPLALALVYVNHFGLSDLYVADLDAILGRPPQTARLHAVADLGVTLWADAGIRSADAAGAIRDAGATRVIVGLETLPSFGVLEEISTVVGADKLVFSLDLRDGVPMVADRALAVGWTAAALAREAVQRGAGTVILLDVARVGMATGIDLALVADLRRALPHTVLLAGGGVRDVADLARLGSAGCDGALVATALMDGRVTPAGIARARRFRRAMPKA